MVLLYTRTFQLIYRKYVVSSTHTEGPTRDTIRPKLFYPTNRIRQTMHKTKHTHTHNTPSPLHLLWSKLSISVPETEGEQDPTPAILCSQERYLGGVAPTFQLKTLPLSSDWGGSYSPSDSQQRTTTHSKHSVHCSALEQYSRESNVSLTLRSTGMTQRFRK